MPDTHFLGATPFGALENIPQAQAVKAKLLDTLVQQLFPKTGGQGQAPTSQAQMQPPLPDPSMGGIVRGTPEPTQTPNALPALPPDVQQQGNNAIWEFLKQMGIPIASTIAGMASPGMLPGAAGLSTGYASGMKEAKDRELEKEKLDIYRSKATSKKSPSKKEIYKMAQDEAFRQMGGSALGGMRLQNPEQKKKYDDLVEALYNSYVERFSESEELGVDTDQQGGDDYERYLETTGNL